MSKQKQIFLEGEGDAWFLRNKAGVDKRSMETDPLFPVLSQIMPGRDEQAGAPWRVLEIGSSNGNRLQNIAGYFGASVHGLEPSADAVAEASARGLDVKRGTADQLPFEDNSFDLVIFGFCLYLCDMDELFKIASEAHRVLKGTSWLLINDFFARGLVQRDYVHKAGIKSTKMDYARMFAWHPQYEIFHHELRDHVRHDFVDDPHEWMAITLIRKLAGKE